MTDCQWLSPTRVGQNAQSGPDIQDRHPRLLNSALMQRDNTTSPLEFIIMTEDKSYLVQAQLENLSQIRLKSVQHLEGGTVLRDYNEGLL